MENKSIFSKRGIKTALDKLSQRRILHHLNNKLTTIASSYVGCPNSEYVAQSIRANFISQFGDLIDEVGIKQKDLVVNVKLPEVDELAESCDSFEEYKLRTAIETGNLPTLAENEFWEKHDPYSRYNMKVDVILKNPKKIKVIDLKFNIDECNKLNEK